MKTKLGISVGLMGAAVYFFVLFDNFFPALILAGYIFLFEANDWLKKTAVKAIILKVSFSILLAIIGFLPDLNSLLNSFLGIFGGHFQIPFINAFDVFVSTALIILQKLLFLFLGFIALHQGSISLGLVDRLVDEHIVKPTE